MDINVLAEQRRETVINLLKGMKIKKTDGDGFDKDDVYLCMQQLCDVYEKSIDELVVNYEEQMADLQDKYQKYDENNDLYISLIMEAKKSSNEIITKAKEEVDEILANGKKEIAKQEEEIEQIKKTAEEERAALQASSEKARKDAEREIAAIADEVSAEIDRANETKGAYKRRLDAMEKEFEEIKTNILRTAGKIDGLKAQLNEEEDAPDWIVKETTGRVDEPEADIAIEEPVEVEVPSAAEVVAPEVDDEKATEDVVEKLTFEDLVAKLQNEEFAGETAAPAAEPVVEIPAAEPVVEIPAAEPVVEMPAAEPQVDEIEFQEMEIELPGMSDEVAIEVAEPAVAEVTEAPTEELTLEEAFSPQQQAGLSDLDHLVEEDLEIQLPEDDGLQVETPIDEISFEGLEELFKE